MQSLTKSFDAVFAVLGTVCKTNFTTINDAKELKTLNNDIATYVSFLETQTANLVALQLQISAKINAITRPVEEQLEIAERKFAVVAIPPVPKPVVTPKITVNIGHGITTDMAFYRDVAGAPEFAWSAVMIHGVPRVIFKFDNTNYVSCTAVEIIDYGTDNYHTVCCSNVQRCEFDRACRYFHDPVIWRNSTHVQKFTKTNLVKRNPYFGNGPDFDLQEVAFEDLRTLARYCAIMLLMIKLKLSDTKSS